MTLPIHRGPPQNLHLGVSRPGSSHVLQVLLCSSLGAVAREEGRSSGCSRPVLHSWCTCRSMPKFRTATMQTQFRSSLKSRLPPTRDAKRRESSCLAGSSRVFASPWHRMRRPKLENFMPVAPRLFHIWPNRQMVTWRLSKPASNRLVGQTSTGHHLP